MLNSQWKLTYDPEVLSFNKEKNSNVDFLMPNASGAYANLNPTDKDGNVISGAIYGNNSNCNLDSLVSASGKEVAFVTATFDVIGTGNTSVNLNVEYLTISNSANEDEIIVNNSAICGHKTAIDATTSVYEGLYSESDKLTVTAKSNFFPTYTQTFDENTDTVTVTYYIKSDKSMENNQWVLTYDPSILKYNESKNQNVTDFMPCVTNGGHANVPSGRNNQGQQHHSDAQQA